MHPFAFLRKRSAHRPLCRATNSNTAKWLRSAKECAEHVQLKENFKPETGHCVAKHSQWNWLATLKRFKMEHPDNRKANRKKQITHRCEATPLNKAGLPDASSRSQTIFMWRCPRLSDDATFLMNVTMSKWKFTRGRVPNDWPSVVRQTVAVWRSTVTADRHIRIAWRTADGEAFGRHTFEKYDDPVSDSSDCFPCDVVW